MPASMMSAEIGGTLKVTGSSIAIVATGPMPGSTPINVPSTQLIRQNNRLSGVIATPKPITRLLKISMGWASEADCVGDRSQERAQVAEKPTDRREQRIGDRPQRLGQPVRQDGHGQAEQHVEDDRRADRHQHGGDDGLAPEHLAAAD